jgi:uncharacterized protein (DUF2126 family)
LLHYGQGKWYPGEEIPRWALGCYWRTDNQPLWRNAQWLANVSKDYGFTTDQAEQFSTALTQRLNINSNYIQPAHEDALYYLWLEQKQPVNAKLRDAKVDSPLERKRLIAQLNKGVNKVCGYVLPLAWNWATNGWSSNHWKLREDILTLIPGDSPMGLRLPLDTLPEPESGELPFPPEADPFRPKTPLAASGHANDAPAAQPRQTQQTQGTTAAETSNTIRTALCFEARDGKLHIFMPPIEHLEHYVSLVEAIEDTAQNVDDRI